jgi:hypothetical protein
LILQPGKAFADRECGNDADRKVIGMAATGKEVPPESLYGSLLELILKKTWQFLTKSLFFEFPRMLILGNHSL